MTRRLRRWAQRRGLWRRPRFAYRTAPPMRRPHLIAPHIAATTWSAERARRLCGATLAAVPLGGCEFLRILDVIGGW